MPQLALRELPYSESEDSEEELLVSFGFWGRGGGGGRWMGQQLRQGQGGLTAWQDGELSLNGNQAFGAT